MFFKDKNILIIGGTGTIGQSLLRQIISEKPKLIRLLSRDEHKQITFQRELGPRKDIDFLIGDVRDYDRLLKAMEDMNYVFHAAALKHVPVCESNPIEAVQTNIMGTNNVIKAALFRNVEKVVFISSDKAVSPTNTYGATKLIAERLIAAAEEHKGNSRTVFATVRFGNVMGSRGSVIPLFSNQIRESKKIKVTDLNMTRFMMTINQATSLTIKALKESAGGEVFVFKMPVVILRDLVTITIEETCKKYNISSSSVDIEEIGLREGEKMYEELMTDDESKIVIELPEMFIIPPAFKKQPHSSHAKLTNKGTYSSHTQPPISQEEIRNYMNTENLI